MRFNIFLLFAINQIAAVQLFLNEKVMLNITNYNLSTCPLISISYLILPVYLILQLYSWIIFFPLRSRISKTQYLRLNPFVRGILPPSIYFVIFSNADFKRIEKYWFFWYSPIYFIAWQSSDYWGAYNNPVGLFSSISQGRYVYWFFTPVVRSNHVH
jgi:hypothetical protein